MAKRTPLRYRSRPQPGQFPAADAARLSRARGGRVPAAHGHHPRPVAAKLRRVLRAGAPARLGAFQARHQARRLRVGDARQYAGHAGMPLRRADDARRAQHAQYAARCADHRLLARPCRGQGRHRRPRILQGDEGGAGAVQGQAFGDRLRRSGIFRPRRAAGRDRIRGLRRARRSRLRLADAAGRVGRHRAQLHLGHHRRSERRGLSPPRRLPPGGWQCRDLLHGQAPGLSVDAADVPLQRLVLPVVDLGRGRHACVPARGAQRRDV